ncbi:LTA synthase family protein [Flavihumibacter petaseus]|uniref:Sulfatase N-terminal domain-containing protein n=1 Tax=Flavihumibacter petaseus NBRC 106054 TaxID=1220578 RepID=A0A0E9MYF6_9BACT|nr:alkaline phosphatase family protein [Flavihumibacter petaseus]GAO42624.1 hypothetical protein FPE01S_01_16390 [Flavihumibacter petaseus NBRC 106054]
MNTRVGWLRPVEKLLNGRFAALFAVLAIYIMLSGLVRITFLAWSVGDLDFNLLFLTKAFVMGFLFDLATGICFLLLYCVYLLIFPKAWIGSIADRIITSTYFAIVLLIIYFSLLAEIPFWSEFGARFNFIAVDYLIYTYEVIANINQSYPLPLIITVLITLVILTFVLLHKKGVFRSTYSNAMPIGSRVKYAMPLIILGVSLLVLLRNKQADFSGNRVINELGKNGVFSFIAAFRANELDYDVYYPKLAEKEAYHILKENLLQKNQQFVSGQWDNIIRGTTDSLEIRPNIVLIAIESFSADFLKSFGNTANLTPFYDSLAVKSVFFTNLYATGTRTVRGMEALTLSVPPTPGNSIVRRPDNQHVFSIGTVLKQKHYHPYFIYGGDGYFDNMNNFFGGQGFDIVDRDRGNPLSDHIATRRMNIPTNEVSFENAWGVCDEDLYRQSIKYADSEAVEGSPFFQFIMTTSNHKPYTFPGGRIDLPQGERNAAVKYTDFALKKYIEDAQKKPWFRNTVFVVVADHCANSAGKWEINIDKHHIPAIFFNLPHAPERIDRLTSQIDIMPTLFGYLHWNYHTALYGQDINQVNSGEERAFIGNYRTLGELKGDVFTQIDDRKNVKQFRVSEKDRSMEVVKKQNSALVSETIAYYQTASERFASGKMKER